MSSSEDVINAADILLREVPNVKISSAVKPQAPRKVVKEEMKTLLLSKNSQEQIMDTLKFIHGEDFVLNGIKSYEDKGMNLSHKYWENRGNLVIKGVCDYSNSNREPENEMDRLKMFAVMRLESYGFHKEHCQEALDYCQGEVESSLKLLYEKYFKLKPDNIAPNDLSESDLLEQIADERGVLESIYEGSFTEKVKNKVWIINCQLDYITEMFCKPKEKVKERKYNHASKKKDPCRFYLKDKTCKYGNKCRFSHEDDPKPETNTHLGIYKYELEVRFPEGSKYPYEAPVIFLKTDAVLPNLLNLHICKRLHQEAMNSAGDGIPSIYSVIELLKNEVEIKEYINANEINFISPDEKLFPKVKTETVQNNWPTHYKKGVTSKDSKKHLNTNEIMNTNIKLAESHMRKQKEKNYLRMQEGRKKLPVWNYKKDILQNIKSAPVVIIFGETGCGKSTQIPQFLLDDWLDNFGNDHAEIVCTQPRRISAIGVAERVADERDEKVGFSVGYQIRLESKVSSNTRLTFCTTGILLRRLEIDPLLSNVTHIVVDEVHERSEESDFLLLILRDLIKLRPEIKIILMSATLNASIFSNYFGDVPIVNVPGRTFPVEQYFLEDILEVSDYVFDEGSQYARHVKPATLENDLLSCEVTRSNAKPRDNVRDESLKINELMARYTNCGMKTCKTLYLMDPEKINLDLIEKVLVWIVSGDHDYPRQGSILVFLPGISEITSLHDQLSCHPEFDPKYSKYMLIPLHSSLTSAEQALVFKKPNNPKTRKIVLSTNIAETSITIDDCIFVIDAGKMKEKHFDSNRNMESLETVWVTRANAQQRKGRAGRVQEGVSIHLYTSHRFHHNFLAQPIPEIQRIPLEQLILNIKILPSLKDQGIHVVLNKLIEPPGKESIDSAIIRLQNVGALDSENNLTPLGHHLAVLPVDVKIGKLMLFGAMFSCIDSSLTMAACLSYKSPFVAPFGKKDLANAKKKKFAMGLSDQLTMLTAYNKFQELNKKSYTAGLNFARENYLSHNTLVTISQIKFQFLELLISIGFLPIDLRNQSRKSEQDNILTITGAEFNQYNTNVRVLSSILCAALYPNVAKILMPEKSYISSAAGAIPKPLEAKDYRFKTKQEQVFLHPSSMIFENTHFSSPFLVYQEKVKTSKIFIRDCCVVPIVPLVLFSGFDVGISVHNGRTFIVLDDNWIMFEVEDHKVAEMMKMMRIELLDLLEEKIKDPLLNLKSHEKGKRIISTILQLVMND